jgi:hypothetical protein
MEHCGVLRVTCQGCPACCLQLCRNDQKKTSLWKGEGSSVSEMAEPDLAGDSLICQRCTFHDSLLQDLTASPEEVLRLFNQFQGQK